MLNRMPHKLSLFLMALALASTGMSCGQNATDEVPPIPTGESAAEAPASSAAELPGEFKVKFETTAGDFVMEVHPKWSPTGAAHFKELVEAGFYDQCRFFRVVPNFMVQWGISGDTKLNAQWKDNNIMDDPVMRSNKRGYVTFAKTGAPNSRSTQIFVNYKDNTFLDSQGFSPFAIVTEGMEVVDRINPEYDERPDQQMIHLRGNEYLNAQFPRLDYILKATLIEEGDEPATSEAESSPEGASSTGKDRQVEGESEPAQE